jgi:phage terminase large subunit GpA-like protein
MDAVSDPSVKEVWVQKSAQTGWTEILNNVIGFHVDQDPAPMLMVQPTLEMGEAWAKDRFAPMVRDTPALQTKIADPKARDSGNTLLHKSFTGGRLTVAGANSPAGLASRPIRIVLFDEVDRFPTSAGTEGDPIALGIKRTRTFWNRKVLAGSTPTVKGSSRIEVGFEQSDQRYYFVPCTHCGEFQRLVWANVRWPDGRPEQAVYVCQHCGVELTDADKPTMLERGEWRSSKPFDGVAGFHISELYSPWSSWSEMAVGFLKAKRLPETLQAWVNTSLGETWEDAGEKLEPEGLLSRRESYTAESLPPGVLLLTMGTDVQDDRLESTVWGWGSEEEAWRVEHVVLRGDPGAASLWADHDALLDRRYATDDGRELVIEATGIDSGGHYTQQVYAYCAKRARRRVWAVKGVGGTGRLVWPREPSKVKRGRVYPVGVDTVKDLLYQRMRRVTEPGPGYVHLDATTDSAWLEQLTSETVVHRITQGRRVRVWRPRQTGIRQEALDCTVYAYCALQGRGGAKLLQTRTGRATARQVPRIEQPTDQAPEVKAQQPKPQQRPAPIQQGWVGRRGSWIRR